MRQSKKMKGYKVEEGLSLASLFSNDVENRPISLLI